MKIEFVKEDGNNLLKISYLDGSVGESHILSIDDLDRIKTEIDKLMKSADPCASSVSFRADDPWHIVSHYCHLRCGHDGPHKAFERDKDGAETTITWDS